MADTFEAGSVEADSFEAEYPGARWLAMRVMRQLVQTGGKADAAIAGVARRFGVSHAALNALAVIESSDGPLPTGEVTAAMHIRTATMTQILDTLERKALISRHADPTDRRRVLIAITSTGQDLLDQLLPAVQQLVTATFGSLDDRTLQALLTDLAVADDALSAVPAEPPTPVTRHRTRRPRD